MATRLLIQRNFHSSSTKDKHGRVQGISGNSRPLNPYVSKAIRSVCSTTVQKGLHRKEQLNIEIFTRWRSRARNPKVLLGVDVPDGLLHMQRKKFESAGSHVMPKAAESRLLESKRMTLTRSRRNKHKEEHLLMW